MGLNQSKDRGLTLNSFNEKYLLDHNASSQIQSIYNGAKIYSNKQNLEDKILSISRQYDTNNVDYNNELKKRFELNHNNLLKLRLVNQHQGACSNIGSIGLYFEWHNHSLLQEIEFRQATEQYFTEAEIIFILTQLVEVLSYLQQNQIFHGDINANYIHLTNQGQIKIGDQGIMNETHNNRAYSRIFANPNYNQSYLAPEEMDLLSLRTSPNQTRFNQFKADVFALGMTLLYCCTLKSPMICYEFGNENKVFNSQVDQLIDEAVTKYSVQLINMIVNMLAYDVRFRPTFLELKQTLIPEFLKYYLQTSTNVIVTSITVNINKSITQFLQSQTSITKSTTIQQQAQQEQVTSQTTIPLQSQLVQSQYIVQQPQINQSYQQIVQTQVQPQIIQPQVQPQIVQPQVVTQVVQPQVVTQVVQPQLIQSLQPAKQIIQQPITQPRGSLVKQPIIQQTIPQVIQSPMRATKVIPGQVVQPAVYQQPLAYQYQPLVTQKMPEQQIYQPYQQPYQNQAQQQPFQQPQQQPQQQPHHQINNNQGNQPQLQIPLNDNNDLDARIRNALNKSSGLIEQANAQKY